MSASSDEVRLKAFQSLLWAELCKIPSPDEASRFLSGSPDVRMKLARDCKRRAQPILAMMHEIESWGISK